MHLIPIWLLLSATSIAQSGSQNRKDEQRENRRVSNAQREWNQTRGELNRVQDSWEKEYRAFLSARGEFLRRKKANDKIEQDAEARLGEQLGIPAQLDVVKQKGETLRQSSKQVLASLKGHPFWKETHEQVQKLETAIDSGIHPSRNTPMTVSDVEELEQTLRKRKRELTEFEQKALQDDPTTREHKSEFDAAQSKLKELRAKLDPQKIERDFLVKKSRTELEAALKTMRSRSTSLEKASLAVERKAKELGQDYQEFLKARQADAADNNRTPKKKTSKKK